MPQEIALYPRLTVAENLGVFAQLAGLGRRERAGGRGAAALTLADVADVARRPVGLLSGGYQRRVNIAASLMAGRASSSSTSRRRGWICTRAPRSTPCSARLREEGAAILIATHDFAEAERLADRVAFMAGGRIVREGRSPTCSAALAPAPPEHEVALADLPDRRPRRPCAGRLRPRR